MSDDDFQQWVKENTLTLGMDRAQARKLWGRPDHINETIGRYGTHEQWVYSDNRYLYFQDGVLTTIQK